jgi:hypothetical protein
MSTALRWTASNAEIASCHIMSSTIVTSMYPTRKRSSWRVQKLQLLEAANEEQTRKFISERIAIIVRSSAGSESVARYYVGSVKTVMSVSGTQTQSTATLNGHSAKRTLN